MVIASIIFGFLFIICGIFFMAAPVSTYMTAMRFFAFLLMVYGGVGIIRFFQRRAVVPEFVVSILSVIIGIIYLFRPGNTPAEGNLIALDRVVLFLTGAWFLVKGCVSIYFSVKTRYFNDRWLVGFFTGLLSAILGIYSIIYPSVAASTIGTLIGFWYIECGIDLIAFGATAGYVENALQKMESDFNKAVKEVQTAAKNYSDQLNAEMKKAAREADEPAPANIPIETPESVETVETVETVEPSDTEDKPEKSE